jgi:hypothetical protein
MAAMVRTKGTSFVWIVKFMRGHREEAKKLLPPELSHYLETRVLSSTWYPASDYWGLVRVALAVTKMGPEAFPQMGQFLARTDLAGIYKSIVKLGDPARTMTAATAIWRNYYDRGELRVEIEERAAVVTLHDFPQPMRELCGQLDGYLPELALAAGAEGVRGVRLSCKAEGGSACRWRVSWT